MEHFCGGLWEGLLDLDIAYSLLVKSRYFLRIIAGVRIHRVIAFSVEESFQQLSH